VPKVTPPSAAAAARSLAGSPGSLAALHAQAELLAPLSEDEHAQLRELLLKLAFASGELTSPPA
jgi:hypothetical protein